MADEYIPHDDPRREENLNKFLSRSQVRNGAGDHVVLYHITPKDFETFKAGGKNPELSGPATWLTPHKDQVSAWHNVRGRGDEFKSGTNVMPVYANITSPLVLDTPDMLEWARGAFANGSKEFPHLIDQKAKSALVEEGYDGIFFGGWPGQAVPYGDVGIGEQPHKDEEIIALHPEKQLKSATGNQGTFDQSNPDITKSEGGDVEGYIPHSDPRREKNFQEWFGKSTAVDGKNNPWVHYHITAGNFSKFIPGGMNPKQSGPAIWLTPHKKEQPAAHNTIERAGQFREGTNVMPLYVKIEKPLFVDESDPEGKARLQEQFGSKSFAWPMTLHPEDIQKMKDAGYDGIYHMQESDVAGRFNYETGEGLETIVFHPSQVKSAIGNDGGFRPHEEDITKADGGALTDEEGITAYHGSPHDFEQFDTSKIGTGEGAQAYGHGLYFAQSEDVAKGYRDKLSVQSDPRDAINDVIYQFKNLRVQEPSHENVKTWMADTPALKEHSNNEQITRRVHEVINAKDDDEAFHSYRELDNLLPPPSKGHMYEVHINAHPDHFADWDKPLSEQPEKVQKYFGFKPVSKPSFVVSETGSDNPAWKYSANGHPAAPTPELALKNAEEGFQLSVGARGKFLHQLMVGGDREKVSKDLANLGVPGIKYLDAGSRGKNENPTRNYVVFNHDHVKVRRKYMRGGAV